MFTKFLKFLKFIINFEFLCVLVKFLCFYRCLLNFHNGKSLSVSAFVGESFLSKLLCPFLANLKATDIHTLYNVCSVHRGMFSTSGGVQYIGGIP